MGEVINACAFKHRIVRLEKHYFISLTYLMQFFFADKYLSPYVVIASLSSSWLFFPQTAIGVRFSSRTAYADAIHRRDGRPNSAEQVFQASLTHIRVSVVIARTYYFVKESTTVALLLLTLGQFYPLYFFNVRPTGGEVLMDTWLHPLWSRKPLVLLVCGGPLLLMLCLCVRISYPALSHKKKTHQHDYDADKSWPPVWPFVVPAFVLW